MRGGLGAIVDLRREKGFALIMTLWVMVFLVVVVTSFALSSKWSIESTINFKQETEAYYLALSGYDLALNYIMNDSNMQIDFIDQEGVFHVDTEHEPFRGKVPLYRGEVEIRITDEQAKININLITPERLRNVLEYIGVESDIQNTLIDSLADWIDPDDLHHANGAESDYYEEYGYKAKDRALDTVEELLLVKGYSDEILYGSDTYRALSPFLTVYGNNAININTVSAEVMRVLGISEVDIENVMSYRDPESGGLGQVPTNLFQYQLNATASSYLRVEVAAGLPESKIQYVVTGIVKRTPTTKGFRVETISWREHVLYS